jgi:plasmid maintenance system antidote protein VapI
MALRLGTLLGTDPKRWLDMQNKFDLWQVQAKLHVELGRIKRTVYVKKA